MKRMNLAAFTARIRHSRSDKTNACPIWLSSQTNECQRKAIAPDLAIEVISPNDVLEKVISKIEDYFAAGVRQVWLVSLRSHTVSIYDSPTKVTILTENEDLTSEAILPGFRCRIADIFAKKRPVLSQPAS